MSKYWNATFESSLLYADNYLVISENLNYLKQASFKGEICIQIECKTLISNFEMYPGERSYIGRDRPEERMPPKPPEQRVWRELEISTELSLSYTVSTR